MSAPRHLVVCRDLAQINVRAADMFVEIAGEAAKARGRFAVALSGGSTPKALYTLLASDAYRSRVDWPKVHLFWGDERCVSPDHPDSNYRMTREALLDKVAANVHRLPAELADAAELYEQTFRQFFQGTPRFDLVLLGMGDDGHTASLFPETAALEVTDRWVVANFVPKFNASRVTLTAGAINAAVHVVFLIAGASKAGVLRDVLEGSREPRRLPSQLIQPVNGQLYFIVDEAAAKELIR